MFLLQLFAKMTKLKHLNNLLDLNLSEITGPKVSQCGQQISVILTVHGAQCTINVRFITRDPFHVIHSLGIVQLMD